MKLLVFTEGTIIMHTKSVTDYASYAPIRNAVEKLRKWKKQGAEIMYLTSRRKPSEIEKIRNVLKKHGFPDGHLFFRRKDEEYKDVAERIVPNVLVEDDCESIGGAEELTITHVKPELKKRIKSIVVREFAGIDHLPDRICELVES